MSRLIELKSKGANFKVNEFKTWVISELKKEGATLDALKSGQGFTVTPAEVGAYSHNGTVIDKQREKYNSVLKTVGLSLGLKSGTLFVKAVEVKKAVEVGSK
jgi:hypothetical protein